MPSHLLNTRLMGNRLNMTYQSAASECGLACLVMIGCYYGHNIDLNYLRQKFSPSLRGMNLLQLVKTAEHIQLNCRPVQCELNELSSLRLPAILHWKMDHYVVIKSVTKTGVVIFDPSLGERKYSMQKVSEFFTGIALEIEPCINLEIIENRPRVNWLAVFTMIPGLKTSLFKLFVLSSILQGLIMLAPLYMQTVVDQVLITHDYNLLKLLVIGFGFLLLFELSVSALRTILTIQVGSRLNLQMSASLFEHLFALPLEWFQKRHKADIISRFGSIEPIKQFFTKTVVEVILDVIMILISLLVLFLYSFHLTLIILAVIFCYGLIRYVSFKYLRQMNEEGIKQKATETSHFIESISAAQTIKLFNYQTERRKHWVDLNATTLNTSIRIGYFQLGIQTINKLLFGIENILVIFLVAQLVMENMFTLGMLFAFMAYKNQMVTHSNRLVETIIQFRMLGLHYERISDIAFSQREQQRPDSYRMDKISIELKDVSFRYAEGEDFILRHFNCQINAGESVVITGPSGIGKSTVLKLMTGLLKPTSGQVLINGIDLEQVGYANFRKHIATVMQDDQLLSGTITDNITLFSKEPDLERMKACACKTGLSDLVETLPMGYQTLIGDMGTSLSGGQQQRLLISRALYQQPKVMFLDEATAHLDASAEIQVCHGLRKSDVTQVVIAHRETTIKASDRIIEMQPI